MVGWVAPRVTVGWAVARVTAAGSVAAPGAAMVAHLAMAVALAVDWATVAKVAAREAVAGKGEREAGWVVRLAQVAVMVMWATAQAAV